MFGVRRSGTALPLATAIVAFGLQEVVYLLTRAAPSPGPPWDSSSPLWGFTTGMVLVGAGLCLLFRLKVALASIILAAAIFVRSTIVYIPGILMNPRDPGNWTSGFELLAMCGAALSLVGMGDQDVPDGSRITETVCRPGRILFGGSLFVFGAQHFWYAGYIARLIPMWIPERLFWAYMVGALFFGAALAILSGRLSRLAATLLAPYVPVVGRDCPFSESCFRAA